MRQTHAGPGEGTHSGLHLQLRCPPLSVLTFEPNTHRQFDLEDMGFQLWCRGSWGFHPLPRSTAGLLGGQQASLCCSTCLRGVGEGDTAGQPLATWAAQEGGENDRLPSPCPLSPSPDHCTICAPSLPVPSLGTGGSPRPGATAQPFSLASHP